MTHKYLTLDNNRGFINIVTMPRPPHRTSLIKTNDRDKNIPNVCVSWEIIRDSFSLQLIAGLSACVCEWFDWWEIGTSN